MYVNCTRSALWLHIKILTMLCYRISGHSTQSTAKRFGKMSFYKLSLIFSHLIADIPRLVSDWDFNCVHKRNND